MKIKTVLWMLFLVNALCAALMSYAFKSPWFFLILLAGLPLLIRRKSILYFDVTLAVLLLISTLAYAVFTFFKVENKEQLFWEVGSLSFYIGYLVYTLLILCSKNFKESFIPAEEMIENGIGWICPQCKAKVHFSIACWNCGAAKAAVTPEKVSGQSEMANAEPSSKLNSYLEKQKEETGNKND